MAAWAAGQCVPGTVIFVTALRRSVTFLRMYRARCSAIRYFPNPLGNGTARQIVVYRTLPIIANAPVILSEQSESKDLRTDYSFAVNKMRRSFDSALRAPLRMTTLGEYSSAVKQTIIYHSNVTEPSKRVTTPTAPITH